MKTKFKTRFLAFIFLLAAPPLIAAQFVDNGDGTVTDMVNYLRWQKCSMGQNNDATCSGMATTALWQAALFYCGNLSLAGKPVGSRRLPNINELLSIVDFCRIQRHI